MKRTQKRTSRPKSLFATLLILLAALYSLLFSQAAPVRLPSEAGELELYSTQAGDDLRATLVQAIEQAQTSILLAVYNLSDRQVIQALRERADAGVQVSVIVDAKAAPGARKALGSRVKTTMRSPVGLMHLKILLIDNSHVYLGSANMSYDSLEVHSNLMIGCTHPPLAQLLTDYLAHLPKVGPPTYHTPQPILFSQQTQTGDLWMLPDHHRHAFDALIEAINGAQKSLKIAMFTWTHPTLTEAVIAAHDRGVEVMALIDHQQGEGTGAEVVHKLQEARVPVRLSRGEGLLHHKLAWIDDTLLIVGSANWTRSAFSRNDDCFLMLRPLTETQQAYMQRVWQDLQYRSSSRR